MTNLLKDLLHNYGLLCITVAQLERERSGTVHSSLGEYYESLGQAEPGEPVLAVRISKDGETRFLRNVDAAALGKNYQNADVTVLELPEDEFYFFRAFRPGLFDLQKELPLFVLQMTLVYGYTLFETYVAELIRLRLRAHPAQLGADKQVSIKHIVESGSKEALIEGIVDRELTRIMYEPIAAILDRLRNRLGLRTLTTQYDQEIVNLSLIRNCLVHNGGRADRKLNAVDSTLALGEVISIKPDLLQTAIIAFRKCALAIDVAFEQVVGAHPSD
jgi:hypothetical protein